MVLLSFSSISTQTTKCLVLVNLSNLSPPLFTAAFWPSLRLWSARVSASPSLSTLPFLILVHQGELCAIHTGKEEVKPSYPEEEHKRSSEELQKNSLKFGSLSSSALGALVAAPSPPFDSLLHQLQHLPTWQYVQLWLLQQVVWLCK